MELKFEMDLVSDAFGHRVEVTLVAGEKRRVIFSDYPNGNYKGGPQVAAFHLVARRFEKAMSELSLER